MTAPVITGTATFSNTHTAPEDAVTGISSASVQVFMQTLANNCKFLYDGGINIRRVATSAALKALTGMTNGEVALLTDSASSRYGLFVFFTGTTSADVTGKRYYATSLTGNWVLSNYDIASNTIIAVQSVSTSDAQSTTSATYANISSSSITIANALVGDKIEIDWSCSAYVGGIGEQGYLRAVANDGGTDYATDGDHWIAGVAAEDSGGMTRSGRYVHTVLTAGTVYVRLQSKATTGTLTTNSGVPRSIKTTHVRP